MTDDALLAFQLVMSRSLARCAATQPDPEKFLEEQRAAILQDATEVGDLIAREQERTRFAAHLEAMYHEAAV